MWLFLSAGIIWATNSPQINAPDYAKPGDVIQISIRGAFLEDMSVSLMDSRNIAVSRAEGFVWQAPDGTMNNVALLGMPADLPPGQCTLTVQAGEGAGDWHLQKTVIVNKRSYPENTIQLSGEMDNLYNDNSERKKKEARGLWSILSKSNPDALYFFGAFIPPLANGELTSDFGERRILRQLNKTETSTIHNGQDFWNERGTPVFSAGKGRVVLARKRILTGNSVIIEHLSGVYTLYYHLDSISISEGMMVAQGAEIGKLGKTGFSTGEHLHWELRVGGIPVNPSQFFDRPLLDTNSIGR